MNTDNIIKSKDLLIKYFEKIKDSVGAVNISTHRRMMREKDPSSFVCQSLMDQYEIDLKSLKRIVTENRIEINRNCLNCGKKLKDIFHDYCSCKCASSDPRVKERKKLVCLEKYGVENVFQHEKVKEKIKKTLTERYGVENPLQSEEVKTRIRQTNIERYGVDSPLKNPGIKEKVKAAIQAKYGVDCTFHSKEIRDKIKKTMIERYGVDSPLKNEKIFNKVKQTNLEHYGVENPSQSKEVKEKAGKSYQRTYRSQKYKMLLELLKENSLELLSNYEDYLNSKQLHFTCTKCGENFYAPFTTRPSIFCKKCSITRYHKSETEVYEFVKSLIPNEEILRNKRKIIPPLELDIYIPTKKLAIEYDGTYWHSANKGTVAPDYHLMKTKMCKEKGIKLIHIFENDWVNRQEIVKSIIRSKLGLNNIKIFARKCKVQELDTKIYREFLDSNHLQGYAQASIKLGLFYQDELVSCIGIGKSRFKKGETELIRFCTKLNTSVIGGLSKLIQDSKVKDLISYLDLRYFDGSGYLKSGFELIGQSKPGYVYVRESEILSRFQCQKHKLLALLGDGFDPNLTEFENMTLNGYSQIFDCGMLKFRLA